MIAGPRFSAWAYLAVLLAFLAPACRQAETPPSPAPFLAAGDQLELGMEPGSLRRFRLKAAAGDFVRLTVEQDEFDAVTRLIDPAGEEVIEVDRSFGDSGPEPLLVVIEQAGVYEVSVEASEPTGPGRILLRIDDIRPAEETDRQAAERFRELRYAEDLRAAAGSAADKVREAIRVYRQVVESSAAAGDGDLWSEAMVRLAFAYFRVGDTEQTRQHLLQVVESHVLGEPLWQIRALDFLASLDLTAGRPSSAIRFAEAGLAKPEAEDFRFRRANLYLLLGQALQQQGAIQPALDAHRRAVSLFRPWDRNLAHPLHHLGALHRQYLGKPRSALDYLERAATVFRASGDQRNLASALNQLAASFEEIKEYGRAADAYREALKIRRDLKDPCAEANTLIRMALLELDASHESEAGRLAAAARAIADGERCLLDRHAIRSRLAIFAERRGELEAARDDFRRVLVDAQSTGNHDLEAIALVGLARCCRSTDVCPEDPLDLTDKALAITENVRGGLAQEDHRLAFGSRTRALFDLRIDLQWQRGDELAAFESAEKARARALLDRLRQAGADVGSGADAELLGEAKQLRYELGWEEQERLKREYRGRLDPEERARRIAKIDSLVAQLNQVEAEIGRHHPEYARLMRAEPAGLASIQGLIDSETVVIAYRLGEARSYLWLVTEDDVRGFDLAPKAVIEAEAARAHDQLTSRRPSAWSPEVLEPLVRQILPVEAVPYLETRRRWRVVADGVLELLPFAALPDPAAAEPRPLLVDREVVHLPSASAWVELRSRPELPQIEGRLALVADPVYGIDDERLPDAVRGTPDPESDDFRRLTGSGREAEAILALLPEGSQPAVFRGLQATRESVLSGALRDHRLVHLSVHGEIHRRQPALSYLAFAEYDAGGRTLGGQLFAYELYDLDLPTELVVLAGCETGLGPRIPGEGLVSGLSRGFLYAGAQQVMVSLWPISDAETPELMTHFYRSLFAGEDAARALHEAQRALYRAGKPPYAWAGFVLQGD